MKKFLLLNILITSFVFLSAGIFQSAGGENLPHVNLRSSYKYLSLSQVQSMPNIYIRKQDKWGFYGHGTITHRYEEKSINGDSVVIDHATGLMWHQSRFGFRVFAVDGGRVGKIMEG